MTILGIFGAGGYAREVMPIARTSARKHLNGAPHEVVFVVRERDGALKVNGHRVLTEEEFFAEKLKKYFSVAIGDSRLRQVIAEKAISMGCVPFECRAENVLLLDDVSIGEGAVLSPSVIMTANIKVGKFFHANLMSYVAHDCLIGDYVTFAPNVHCNGNVVIHDHAYIGTGAVLKHGSATNPLRIGRGAVVGMGAVVTKDVPDGAVVVGNPARPISQKN